MRVHYCFSLGYGILKPEELVAWALQHGHQQLLLTDINHTGSGLAFARAAQEQGLEPLLGLELRNGLQQVATIIARNNNGFQELNTFLSQHLLAAKPFELPLPSFANSGFGIRSPNTQRIYRHMSSSPSKPSKYCSGSGKSAPLTPTNMLRTSP